MLLVVHFSNQIAGSLAIRKGMSGGVFGLLLLTTTQLRALPVKLG